MQHFYCRTPCIKTSLMQNLQHHEFQVWMWTWIFYLKYATLRLFCFCREQIKRYITSRLFIISIMWNVATWTSNTLYILSVLQVTSIIYLFITGTINSYTRVKLYIFWYKYSHTNLRLSESHVANYWTYFYIAASLHKKVPCYLLNSQNDLEI